MIVHQDKNKVFDKYYIIYVELCHARNTTLEFAAKKFSQLILLARLCGVPCELGLVLKEMNLFCVVPSS